ncbi:dipeptide/oligopeptide/nickel ABC transporter permease/ATP-binding protein [Phytohabitans sp. ZYX-F-186]|uniref:Dipeptide/oligopeptide/nickel ABC transporter permease/ATP-binding protein n=1 Tax=Phytohabitans maris TaxID=3071409 RepID=A0ABU0ZER4_9ACTN|nr:dipeptide/oligopeptide/nickel ABC transporter permease/ATP-binding protein [Phytohabitans sp. ZYX-F-186]MDQ7905551.1 dipeptide/oligopeptide/nickel ABC transporter permease/ATP-binding protein [Phytohabitans sp. ZYX-F-186]
MTYSLTPDTNSARPQRVRFLRSLRRHPLGALALGLLLLLAAGAILADLLAPYDPTATDLGNSLSGPTGSHLLGTDALGRDLLSRLLFGARVSLTGTAQAVATVIAVGVPIGLLAGYLGGWVDRVAGGIIDVLLAVPGIVMLLVIVAIFGNNESVAMIALGVLGAPGMARVVRGSTIAVRNELYIKAARVSGLTTRHVLVNHVLPRVSGPIVVRASLFAGVALLVETGLGFLGFGAQPPDPSWGNMVADASQFVAIAPWMLVPSGATIALSILSFGLLGDAIRDSTAGRARGADRVRRKVAGDAKEPAATPAQPATETPDDSDALLRVRGLTVSVPAATGQADIISDVTLEIRAGETVGLVGESGCGKSMTGRAILGLLPQPVAVTGGRILFDGQDITKLGPRQLQRLRGAQIALISQEPVASLDPVFTVGHQLKEVLLRHQPGSRREIARAAVALLRDVNLREPERVMRSYPHQLSGGMAQRVAIAMALAGRPRLLVADEPTTALDVTVQAEILGLLRRLQRQTGMAVLIISHDWGVIADVCERAYVMYAGQVVEQAPVLDLFDGPRHPYSAGLLGCMPGRAARGDLLPAIGGRVPQPGSWPTGCHFSPRCPIARDDCTRDPVALNETAAGHASRCLYPLLVDEKVFSHDAR